MRQSNQASIHLRTKSYTAIALCGELWKLRTMMRNKVIFLQLSGKVPWLHPLVSAKDFFRVSHDALLWLDLRWIKLHLLTTENVSCESWNRIACKAAANAKDESRWKRKKWQYAKPCLRVAQTSLDMIPLFSSSKTRKLSFELITVSHACWDFVQCNKYWKCLYRKMVLTNAAKS